MTLNKPTEESPNFDPALAYEILQSLERTLPVAGYPVRLKFRPRVTMRFGTWNRPRPGRPWHTINISAWLDDAEMEETLRHEYAHALLGKGGHGTEWEALARQTGCQYINVTVAPPKLVPWKYEHRCPCGDILLTIQRLPSNRRCRACGKPLHYAKSRMINLG